jgi:hypothetical protein
VEEQPVVALLKVDINLELLQTQFYEEVGAGASVGQADEQISGMADNIKVPEGQEQI